jgi:hypothetical protein
VASLLSCETFALISQLSGPVLYLIPFQVDCFIQAFIMVAGAIVVAVIGFQKVNGYTILMSTYPYAIASEDVFSNRSCSLAPKDSLSIIRDVDSDLPWPGKFCQV